MVSRKDLLVVMFAKAEGSQQVFPLGEVEREAPTENNMGHTRQLLCCRGRPTQLVTEGVSLSVHGLRFALTCSSMLHIGIPEWTSIQLRLR